MSVVYESEVVRVVRAFKASILADEEAQTRLLARAYLDIEHHLADSIAALSEQLARLVAAGEDVPYWKLARLERWQSLQAQTLAELARFNGWAVSQIRDEQLRLAVLGMQHAAQAAETMKPGIAAMLDRMNPAVVRAMVGLAGDGSPLATLLERSGRGVLEAMRRELQRSVALGRNPKVTAAAVRKASGLGLQRALTIARTEQLRVYRAATLETYRAMGVTQYERICAYDDRTCIGCLAAAGEIVPSEFAIDDHPRGRCFVGDTFVSGPVPVAATSRKYSGEVVSIRTSSGNLVTVTPNHPILTDRGWVGAGLLREGDHVVSDGGFQHEAAAVDPHEYQVPTRIEDVGRAPGMDRLAHVPAASEDFHGDGAGGDVHVVWSDRLLRDGWEASLAQPFGQLQFGGRYTERALLARDGALALLLHRLLVSGRHVVHELGQLLTPLGAHVLAYDAVGLGTSTRFDFRLAQPRSDRAAGDAERLAERLLRLSCLVARDDLADGESERSPLDGRRLGDRNLVAVLARAEQPARLQLIREALLANVEARGDALRAFASHVVTDRVLEVGSRRFSGHVYNLQTQGQWYSANGIIAHNCSAVPVIPGIANPVMESGQSWFDRQDEATQLHVMGPGRLAAYKSGAASFKDMATHVHDDTWGGAWVPTPVTNLATGKMPVAA